MHDGSGRDRHQAILALPGPQYWFDFDGDGANGQAPKLIVGGEPLQLVVEGNQVIRDLLRRVHDAVRGCPCLLALFPITILYGSAMTDA